MVEAAEWTSLKRGLELMEKFMNHEESRRTYRML